MPSDRQLAHGKPARVAVSPPVHSPSVWGRGVQRLDPVAVGALSAGPSPPAMLAHHLEQRLVIENVPAAVSSPSRLSPKTGHL
jgi:hypothetical protein